MSCPYDPSSASKTEESCPYNPESTPAARKTSQQINKIADEPIPQPPIHWFTKNLPEINPSFPTSSIWRLADIYGPIYKLDFVTRQSIVLSSHELINEACDEDRFDKHVKGSLEETRALLGDGLFTAYPDEPVHFYIPSCSLSLVTDDILRIGGKPIES